MDQKRIFVVPLWILVIFVFQETGLKSKQGCLLLQQRLGGVVEQASSLLMVR